MLRSVSVNAHAQSPCMPMHLPLQMVTNSGNRLQSNQKTPLTVEATVETSVHSGKFICSVL